jgi:hypothetical protein
MTYREESLRRLAWAVYGLSIVGLGVSLYLDSASGQHGDVLFGVVVFTIPTVGFIVLTRRPRTILGWLMLSMGVAFALPLESYANYALTGPLAPLPGGAIALALSQPIWVPFIGISGYLLLLFPDGHVPTPRWRWFSWMCGIGLVVLSLVIIFSPGTFEDSGYPNITNPLGLEWLGPWAFVTVVFAPLIVVGGAVGVFRRLRRTTDQVQRQQLRWLAWSAALIAGSYVLAFFPQLLGAPAGSQWENWLSTLAVFSFILIPITIGLAVLRYRLYDIDVVIRKTVVVAVLVVFVAIVYVALVAAIGVFVGTRYSNVASGIAAAVVALAFQPVRRWARRAADRLVYGTRATPYEVLTEFGENLADTYGAEDVLPRLARVLGEGVGAQRARVWLDSGASRRIVATWAADDDGGADARRDDDDLVEEVRHQGRSTSPGPSSSRTLRRRRASSCGTLGWSRICGIPVDASSPHKTSSGASSSATSMTARNSSSWRWPSRRVSLSSSSPAIQTEPPRCWRRSRRRPRPRWRISAISPAASTRPYWRTRASRRRWRRRVPDRRSPSRCTQTAWVATRKTSRPRRTSRASRRCRTWRSTRRHTPCRSRSRGPATGSCSWCATTGSASIPTRSATAPDCRGSLIASRRWVGASPSPRRPAMARP